MSLHASTPVEITVTNPLPQYRNEMVEADAGSLPQKSGVLRDSQGFEVPWQLTYDGKIVFPASVSPMATAVYTFEEGTPSKADTIACASFHPERLDDIAWENDFAAYRAYGPALAASGGAAYGYDIWTKSNTRPLVIERYLNELERNKSYHIDHGDGMDVYEVGLTLGGGLAAPLDREGNMIYPGCFSTWEILDNGPLRTTLRLTYEYGGGKETRIITLDAGNPLNRTTVKFEGFESDSIAAGIVVHKPLEHAYTLGKDYVCVTDPTQKPDKGNGLIFAGLVNTNDGTTTRYIPLDKNRGAATGHAVTVTPCRQGEECTYYWGACWNKGRVISADQWRNTMEEAAQAIRHPLSCTIK